MGALAFVAQETKLIVKETALKSKAAFTYQMEAECYENYKADYDEAKDKYRVPPSPPSMVSLKGFSRDLPQGLLVEVANKDIALSTDQGEAMEGLAYLLTLPTLLLILLGRMASKVSAQAL